MTRPSLDETPQVVIVDRLRTLIDACAETHSLARHDVLLENIRDMVDANWRSTGAPWVQRQLGVARIEWLRAHGILREPAHARRAASPLRCEATRSRHEN